MVGMLRARARRLSPRTALILEAITWFIPPVLLFGLNLYSNVAGTGRTLLLCAGAAAVFIPWAFRARFFSAGKATNPEDAGITGARLRGRVLFGLLQILWAGLLLPLSAPIWLWALLLIFAFLPAPALAGSRAINIAPGALVILGIVIALFAGAAPATKTMGVWTQVAGAKVRGSLDYTPGIALFLILLPVLLRPGRKLLSVVLFFAFGAVTAYAAGVGADIAALIPPLAFAALLVFAPGRPLRGPAGWFLYYGLAGIALAILVLVPAMAKTGNFARPLLLSLLAAELITPILLFPFKTAARRDS